jgi:hypothetical protein
MSFDRATFYQVKPVFHQIYSSHSIDTDWLNILFTSYQNQKASETHSSTLIGTAFAYFQSLRIMSDLTKQAVINAQNFFLGIQVASAYMLDYNVFDGQTTAALTLQMLLGMAQGNGLVSGYSTNWSIFLPNMTKDATIYTKALIYDECNCATSVSCNQSSTPYVPGFDVGCLPLESFLRSTIECLFNQSCVDTISSFINASIIPRALNITNSRFASCLIKNDIVREIFIKSWSLSVSYENFFQQCRTFLISPSTLFMLLSQLFLFVYLNYITL